MTNKKGFRQWPTCTTRLVELRLVCGVWAARSRTEPELPVATRILTYGSDALLL